MSGTDLLFFPSAGEEEEEEGEKGGKLLWRNKSTGEGASYEEMGEEGEQAFLPSSLSYFLDSLPIA